MALKSLYHAIFKWHVAYLFFYTHRLFRQFSILAWLHLKFLCFGNKNAFFLMNNIDIFVFLFCSKTYLALYGCAALILTTKKMNEWEIGAFNSISSSWIFELKKIGHLCRNTTKNFWAF